MINQPETQEPNPQPGKLVLPVHPHEMSPVNSDQANHLTNDKNQQNAHLRPDQLIRQTTPPPPRQPFAKLRYYWQKDPAYKVLLIAIAMVMVAGLVFVSLISNVLLRNPNFLAIDSTTSSLTAVTPTSTVDLHPAFPLPGGGNGSTSSSQPPAHSTPILQPTSNATASPPTPTPVEGSVTVTITSIPVRVSNNSIVNVGVNTSLPNVSVSLVAYYTVPPYRYTSSSTITNGNGNASLSWSVSLLMFGRHTQAMVFAIARDQNGQKVQSQAIAVQVNSNGG